jgi:hypothetical protein
MRITLFCAYASAAMNAMAAAANRLAAILTKPRMGCSFRSGSGMVFALLFLSSICWWWNFLVKIIGFAL